MYHHSSLVHIAKMKMSIVKIRFMEKYSNNSGETTHSTSKRAKGYKQIALVIVSNYKTRKQKITQRLGETFT